ncbi:hypothetical protein J1614_005271 [Plenodomus biglobosus]|nr:hypothetical protein J1614_005271 [Plenodomus biglobosus]
MSAEDAVPDKGQAPKPAATFTSFINKNTTGKKFAPKAARRRPGAAPPAAPPAAIPAPSLPEPAPSTTEPEPANAPAAQPPPVTQLPTPAATQEPVPSSAPTPPPQVSALNSVEGTPIAPLERPSTAAERAPTPARTAREESREPAVTCAPNVLPTSPVTRPETDAPQRAEETQAVAVETPSTAPDTVIEVAEVAETPAVQEDIEPSAQTPSRKRRRLPWVAVNHPQDEEPDEDLAAPPKKTRRKTKATTSADASADAEHVQQQDGNDDDSQPLPKRPSAKAGGKRKAAVATEGEDQDQPAPRKARKPRKPRPAVVDGTEAEGDAAQPVDSIEITATRRKPRKPKRRVRNTTEVEGGEGEADAQPKRKGRPPREPTPSDAEDHTIDPEETFMNSLASRNIRVGRLSNREKEMRKVDWAAVKERRREEDSRPIQSKQEQEAADRALAEASAALEGQQIESGPRFREIDGEIRMVPDSGTIDREADADREIAEYEIIEDQDITARVTSRSFLKNNKRFPNDFILPGQGRRWNIESTDLFYQGLKSFGTDFQMISQMFPGSTRRSIKTKFTREERENPERVREALHGQSEIVSHWSVFLEASQRNDDSFVDADEIKRQLAEDEAIMREKIAAAKAETEERNRQKAAAGVLDDEGGEAGDKENGKKKRREKGKQVSFQEEQGVEIMGTIDDDDTWGQE